MADVQTVTGLGILLSGYSDLKCFISAYHWQVIVYLAWLSNTTHIACLSACRAYLFRHQFQRNVRLFFMFLLWLGLLLAMIPTAYFNWRPVEPSAAQPWSPARCFYDHKVARALYNETICVQNRLTGAEVRVDANVPGAFCWDYKLEQSSAFTSAILSGLVLGLGSLFSVVRLTRSTSNFARVHVRRRISGWWTKGLVAAMDKNASERDSKRRKRAREVFIILPLTTVYVTAKLLADLLTSEIVGVGASLTSSRCFADLIRFFGSPSRPYGEPYSSNTHETRSTWKSGNGDLVSSSPSFSLLVPSSRQ